MQAWLSSIHIKICLYAGWLVNLLLGRLRGFLTRRDRSLRGNIVLRRGMALRRLRRHSTRLRGLRLGRRHRILRRLRCSGLPGQRAHLLVDLLRVAAQHEQQQREFKHDACNQVAGDKHQQRAEKVGKQQDDTGNNNAYYGDAVQRAARAAGPSSG